MELWIKYALVAAVFIALCDLLKKRITKKYTFIEYTTYAVTIAFIGLWAYIYANDVTIGPMEPEDIFTILIRVLVIYLIVEPCIFYSLKNCDNAGEVSSIIGLNAVFAFFLSIYFFKNKFNFKNMIGVGVIIMGGVIIGYNKPISQIFN